MSNIMKDMRNLIENIENNQLKNKIFNVAKKYNITKVKPIQVFLRDGKPVDHETGGNTMMQIDDFALMASYKINEYEDNIIVYGALEEYDAEEMDKKVDMVRVTQNKVSMVSKAHIDIINEN